MTREEQKIDILIHGIKDNCYEVAEDIINEYGKQIRADAIDEFANELIEPDNYEGFDFDDCLDNSDKAIDFIKYVFSLAEQLKEKNK